MKRTITISILLLLFFLPQLDAQNVKVKKQYTAKTYARSVIKRANKIRLKDAEEAKVYLNASLQRCAEFEDGESCYASIYFTMGYFNHQDAQVLRNKKHKKRLLLDSEAAYKSAIRYYPNNVKMLDNLLLVQRDLRRPSSMAKTVGKLIEIQPQKQDVYERELGDAWLRSNNLNQACRLYKNAFRNNPHSIENIRKLVELYKSRGSLCTATNLMTFIYQCNDYGFPNYAIELLEFEMMKTNDRAILSSLLVHWANIRAENNQRGLANLESNSALKNGPMAQAIRELDDLYIRQYPNWNGFLFWNSTRAIYHSKLSGRISPFLVAAKIVNNRAKTALRFNNFTYASRLQERLLIAFQSRYNLNQLIDNDPTVLLDLSTGLANLYYFHKREVDHNGRKLDALMAYLFRAEKQSYETGNKYLIRKFHATVGEIMYRQKKVKSPDGANAAYQLQKALSSELEATINPPLKKMLGDVYLLRKEKTKAAQTYMEITKDYLSLDQTQSAVRILDTIQRKGLHRLNAKQGLSFVALNQLTQIRSNLEQPSAQVIFLGPAQFNQTLEVLEKSRDTLGAILGKEFVDMQFFKGYTDLAKKTSVDQLNYRQQLNAKSLRLIKGQRKFSTIRDFDRIQNINASFNFNSNTSKHLKTIKKKSNSKTQVLMNNNLGRKYQTIAVTNLGIRVDVPVLLFDASDKINEFYKTKGSTKELPKLEMKAGELILNSSISKNQN